MLLLSQEMNSLSRILKKTSEQMESSEALTPLTLNALHGMFNKKINVIITLRSSANYTE